MRKIFIALTIIIAVGCVRAQYFTEFGVKGFYTKSEIYSDIPLFQDTLHIRNDAIYSLWGPYVSIGYKIRKGDYIFGEIGFLQWRNQNNLRDADVDTTISTIPQSIYIPQMTNVWSWKLGVRITF